jgi:hypothetical protein
MKKITGDYRQIRLKRNDPIDCFSKSDIYIDFTLIKTRFGKTMVASVPKMNIC